MGAIVPAWILLLLECARRETQLRAVWRASFLGLIAQIVGPGVLVPIYAAWDLFMIRPSSIRIAESTIHFIRMTVPVSILFGGILPFATLLLPTPSWISYGTKQYLIVIFQLWPVLIFGLILALSKFRVPAQDSPQPSSHHGSLYLFALTFASTCHLGVYILATASVVLPTLFGSAVAANIHPVRLLLPKLPWSGVQSASIEEGIFWPLQWDYGIMSVSILLWAVEHLVREKRKRMEKLNYAWFVLKLFVLVLFCGPCGAAVQLMWERENTMQSNDKTSEGGKRHVE